MVAERAVMTPPGAQSTSASSGVATAGALAGLVGAATIAAWFLLLDSLDGRPLYTPAVLGTALFHGGAHLANPATLHISVQTVLVFTWVHTLCFVIIGGAASYLLAFAERDANLGFGVVLLFVVFECGFIAVCMLVAQPVLHALTWPAVLVGNLLAAGTMGLTLWRWHPGLRILP